MTGRGAWSTSGVGGTLSVDGRTAGPYFVLADGPPRVGSAGWASADPNERAVHGGVLAIQRALARRLHVGTHPDGSYGPRTAHHVAAFQRQHEGEPGISVWSGVGQQTAKALLLPDLKRMRNHADVPWQIICGVITAESGWDPAAVGYTDPRDVGLAQINAEAHPEWSEQERLRPQRSFRFVADYLAASLKQFYGDMDAAICSYNLGIGGASAWIRAGRPDEYTPAGSTQPRDMAQYISRIRTACNTEEHSDRPDPGQR